MTRCLRTPLTEFGHTVGVDATSGPLGQGIAMAVGMAQAERFLASRYNKEGFPIFDHYTYVIAGDGLSLIHIYSLAQSTFSQELKTVKLSIRMLKSFQRELLSQYLTIVQTKVAL